ncbi:MAG TPA: TRAP transporter large permease, partial [Candidatus Methylomirabilis sp.]|nr:TRAP transporter large permease [Candidatus Methylomirabilis sp.]
MLWLFVVMLVLFAVSAPIAWSMAIAAAVYMAFGPHIPLQGMVQRMIGGIDTFPLLAIPFFILAGNLMNTGGITDRLVTFAKALVGHIMGGLAHVVVVTNMIMAGMSGSGVADAAGTGTVLIPAMRKVGYSIPFAAAIVGAAGTIGPIIPPSIPFVLYGSIASVSIGRLLLGGAVPGVLMGIMLMVFVYVIAKRRRYPSETRATWGALGKATLHAIPPMGMPLIILGGIVFGVMTPTEAAAAGAAYAFILGFCVYREIRLAHLPGLITDSVVGTASIVIIMSAAQPFSWVLTYELAPMKVLALFQDAHLPQWQVYLLLNVIMLVLGCFMEGLAVMVMAIPVLLPLLQHAGIDLVHFGVVFVLNIMIGAITPPVGTIMYVVCALSRISIAEFAREVWPFVIALTISLLLVTYMPWLALWLPDL